MNDDDLRLSQYQFDLGDDQIARRPTTARDDARLLVLARDDVAPRHMGFRDVVSLLNAGDCLVVNDTTVIPARLYASRAETGGRVEVILGRALGDGTFSTLLRPARRMKPGARLVFGAPNSLVQDPFFATVERKLDDEPGAFAVRFEGDPIRFAEALGEIPLPPYMNREADDDDKVRYQTVYADPAKPGSSAAPTAGLHFTDDMMARIVASGVDVARVTLHVGAGTFLPVRTDDVREHKMHAEPYVIDDDAASTLNAARARGGRIIAVGTTALRTLESAVNDDGTFAPCHGTTRLFITPGHRFRAVDALITNFHLPESTLLMLVAAFVGRTTILDAYRCAVESGYRFFSYGDSSFLERRELPHGSQE